MANDFISLGEIIIRLKEKRDEQNLSYDDINRLIEKNGDYPLSKSTLSRVFKEGSEDERFDYEDTIRPLAKALLDIENIEETDTEDVKTLKYLLKLKMQRINELEAELERLAVESKRKHEGETSSKSVNQKNELEDFSDKRRKALELISRYPERAAASLQGWVKGSSL